MDCIEGLIGVSNNLELPFYEELNPTMQEAIIASSAGLYLDKLPGGVDLKTVDSLAYMEQLLTSGLEAIKQAETTLKNDLLIALNNRFQAAKPRFSGDIGRKSISATLNSTGDIQGHRYRMFQTIAGNIKIDRIAVCISAAATFNVYVSRCDARSPTIDELLYTFPVTSVIGNWVNADMSSQPGGITLPMQIEGVEQEYYITWKRSEAGGAFAKNNDIICGTCMKTAANYALENFMHYDGIALNDLDRLLNASADKRGHGLSVSATVGCENNTVLCREFDKKEAISLMMSWANYYKAGELWIEYIFKSGYVSKTNLQNREYLWGKRNHFVKEYNERITAIANGMNIGETNCYVCKEDKGIKATIFS